MTDGSRPMTRVLRRLAACATLAAAIVVVAPEAASATHVFPSSTASCDRQDAMTGTFACTLTIVIGEGPYPGTPVVRIDDDPSIGVRPVGAAYADVPVRTGGTCAATPVRPSAGGVALILTADLLGGCTILLRERFSASAPGEVCHSLTAVATNSYAQLVACADLLPPLVRPASKADCKKGGWRTFPPPGFDNQGACVSSVARGKSSPQR